MYIVRSPQAMLDIMPVPWPQRGLSDIGFPSAAIEAAMEQGIRCLGDLRVPTDRAAFVKELTAYKGVGAKTAEKIANAYWAYRGEA